MNRRSWFHREGKRIYAAEMFFFSRCRNRLFSTDEVRFEAKMRRDVSQTEEDLFWRPTKNLVNKIEAGWIERHAEAEVEVEEDGEEEESLRRRQVNLLQLLRLPLLSR